MKKYLIIVFSLLLMCKLYAQERIDRTEPKIEILATSQISDETKKWEYDERSGKWNSYPCKNVSGFNYFNVIKFLYNNKLFYAFAYSKSTYHSFSIYGIAATGEYGSLIPDTHCFIITEEKYKTLKLNLFKKDGKTIRIKSGINRTFEGTTGKQDDFLRENTLKHTLKTSFRYPDNRMIFFL